MRISFLTALILGIVAYKIIKLFVEAYRDAQLARVKADLKMRLLEKVQDPVLLRDILEQDLDLSPEGLQLHKEAWDKIHEEPLQKAARSEGGWRFVTGMTSFFFGVGALVGSVFTYGDEHDGLLAAGFFLVFLGWILLGWHVYSQERKEESSTRSQGLQEGIRVPDRSAH